MGNKANSFPIQRSLDTLSKDVLSHMSIYCTQGIVQEVDVTIGIERPRQADTLFLTAAQVDSSLSNLKFKKKIKSR